SRTMLRLRHDLVILGRAGAEPLPETLRKHLERALIAVGTEASDFLTSSATALDRRDPPPPLDAFAAALAAYTADIEDARHQGLTVPLSSSESEPLFALGFAFDQLHHNFIDLQRCVRSYARKPKKKAKDS